jgi:hypothetical protein
MLERPHTLLLAARAALLGLGGRCRCGLRGGVERHGGREALRARGGAGGIRRQARTRRGATARRDGSAGGGCAQVEGVRFNLDQFCPASEG